MPERRDESLPNRKEDMSPNQQLCLARGQRPLYCPTVLFGELCTMVFEVSTCRMIRKEASGERKEIQSSARAKSDGGDARSSKGRGRQRALKGMESGGWGQEPERKKVCYSEKRDRQGRKTYSMVLTAYLGGKPREESVRIRAHLHTEVCNVGHSRELRASMFGLGLATARCNPGVVSSDQ